jgi:hypothetical protein
MTPVQASGESAVESGYSPRSTVLADTEHMHTKLASMNGSNMASGLSNGDAKVASPPSKELNTSQADPPVRKETGDTTKSGAMDHQEGKDHPHPDNQANAPSPSQQPNAQGYYLGYPPNDAPPSPAVSGPGVTSLPYDQAIGAFSQQPGTFAAAHTSSFGVPNTNTPLSPPRSMAGMVGAASPLFPRVMDGGPGGGVAPQSPSLPYMSPALGSYAARAGSQIAGASDESWDRYVATQCIAVVLVLKEVSKLTFLRRLTQEPYPQHLSVPSIWCSRYDVWHHAQDWRPGLLL